MPVSLTCNILLRCIFFVFNFLFPMESKLNTILINPLKTAVLVTLI